MVPVSVILPTFNEADNILGMIDDVGRTLAGADFEVIVVDDDSPDGTSTLVADAARARPWLRLITRKANRGLIASINEGVEAARHDVCVWMDSDRSMRADAIPRFIAEIEKGADLAIGSRYIEGGGVKGSNGETRNLIPIRRQLQGTGDSFLQVVLSLWGNRLLHRLLTAEVTDFTSGYYAVRRNLVRDVGLRGTYVDYCIRLAYLASLRGYVIAEVPVVVHPRMGGASKTATSISGLFRISLSCLRTAWELRMHRRDFQRRKAGR